MGPYAIATSVMANADLSLDAIIKKKNVNKQKKMNKKNIAKKGKSAKNTKFTKAKVKRFGKQNIITWARKKIVKGRKLKIKDARERLGQLARKGDLRDRLGRLARMTDARDRLNNRVFAQEVIYNHPVMFEEVYAPTVVYADELAAPIRAITEHVRKGASKVPADAASMHPVMLLHQMKPGIQYATSQATGADGMSYFYVSADVDGENLQGRVLVSRKLNSSLL